MSEKESVQVTVQAIKSLGDLSETSIEAVRDIIVELHKASQSNALMGIVDALVTVNFLRKLGIVDPQVEASVVSTITSLLGLNVQTQQVALAGQIVNLFTFGIAGGGAVAAGISENILIPKLSVRTDISFEATKAPIAGIITEGEKQAAAVIGALGKLPA